MSELCSCILPYVLRFLQMQRDAQPAALCIRDSPGAPVEIASLSSVTDGRINCLREAVTFFRDAEAARASGLTSDVTGRSFVRNTLSLYDSLQYPLLFPTGRGGWFCSPPDSHWNAAATAHAPEPTIDTVAAALTAAEQQVPGRAVPSVVSMPPDSGAMDAGTEHVPPCPFANPEQQPCTSSAGCTCATFQALQQSNGDDVDDTAAADNLPDDEPAGGEGDGEGGDSDGEAAGGGAHAKSKWRYPESTMGTPLTVRTFTKAAVFQCVILMAMARLMQEWVLGQFSRWQEIQFATIDAMKRSGKLVMRRSAEAVRAAARVAGSAAMGPYADLIGKPAPDRLPGSVPGSKAYQQRLIDDGMAVIETMGKPTLWITVTCNPNWPEFQQAFASSSTCQDRVDLQVWSFRFMLHFIVSCQCVSLCLAPLAAATVPRLQHLPEGHPQALASGHVFRAQIDVHHVGCGVPEAWSPTCPYRCSVGG